MVWKERKNNLLVTNIVNLSKVALLIRLKFKVIKSRRKQKKNKKMLLFISTFVSILPILNIFNGKMTLKLWYCYNRSRCFSYPDFPSFLVSNLELIVDSFKIKLHVESEFGIESWSAKFSCSGAVKDFLQEIMSGVFWGLL